jgi:hypothetical protein
MAAESSYVQSLGAQLLAGLEGPSADSAAVVWGVSNRFILGNRGMVLRQIRRILVDSGQVFVRDGDVVFEQRSEVDGPRLVTLMQDDQLTRAAPSHLASLVCCAMPGKKNAPVTCQPPGPVLAEVLNSPATRDQLPRVKWYGRRPVFDADFQLLQPGYHDAGGTLVHGDAVAPVCFEPPAAAEPLDRLPPGLRRLVKDFCFATPADLVAAVAMLLTGVLMNHLVAPGKPVFLVNGNQRGLGKTLLAEVVGVILDGDEPPLLHYTEDEDELGKRLGAKIKSGSLHSLLFFDNQKGLIGGRLLESLALASRVSVRRMKCNEDISRSNDFLWIFTANSARATPDMASRGVLLQLHYEGDPRQRFVGTGIEGEALKRYARQNRTQILGELLGMVIRWRDMAMPKATKPHRCKRWAALVGGILLVAGLTEFLAGQEELAAEVDEELQELAALAECVLAKNKTGFFVEGAGELNASAAGKKPKEWVSVFRESGLGQKELVPGGPERSHSTFVGKFFTSRVGKAVPVQVGDKVGEATLRAKPGAARQRLYWIEVVWQDAAPASEACAAPTGAAQALDDPTPPQASGPMAAPSPAASGSGAAPVAPTIPGIPGPAAMTTSPPPAPGGNDLNW